MVRIIAFTILFFLIIITVTEAQNFKLPYDLTQPVKKYKLPKKLVEICGLCAMGTHEVASIEDEDARIYVYDLDKDDVTQKVKFGKHGDFEGITLVDGYAYMLRSDGEIFEMKDWQGEFPDVIKYKTFLKKGNNTEGLCYDEQNNRLLIACKGKGGEGGTFWRKKAVYAFDLTTKQLLPHPVLLVETVTSAMAHNVFLPFSDSM